MTNKKVVTFKTPDIVQKGWGYEEIIYNGPEYCGKILHYNKGAKSSLHIHLIKKEHFRCVFGAFKLTYINGETAERVEKIIIKGNIIEIPPGAIHGIECLEEGEIFEVSTSHSDNDVVRVEKGDSQTKPTDRV